MRFLIYIVSLNRDFADDCDGFFLEFLKLFTVISSWLLGFWNDGAVF